MYNLDKLDGKVLCIKRKNLYQLVKQILKISAQLTNRCKKISFLGEGKNTELVFRKQPLNLQKQKFLK